MASYFLITPYARGLMDLFHENLAKWALLNPQEPDSNSKLGALNPLSVSFCTAENGMPNLALLDPQGTTLYLHSSKDPQAEAKEWFTSLRLGQEQVIYVYGLGLGYYYEAAKDWLNEDKDRYLVFIEDDAEVMRRFLETDRCREMLDNPQVCIRLLGARNDQVVQFTDLTSLFSALDYIYSGLKCYVEAKPAFFSEFKSTISFLTTMHRMLYTEAAGHGLAFFRNFYLNFLNVSHSNFGNGLLGKFKGVPAIICGAGPSLDKNIDVLSTLSDRALIFAGGTALNALNGKGVMPHFGVGIDPNPDQFTRLVMNHAFELPFIYRCRMLNEALEMVHGDRLYLTGSGGYEIGKWFENRLGVDEPEIGEGFNVLNFSLMVAYAMGCNPIICAGIDLAYSGGESYAAGVASHPVHNRKSNFRTKKVEDELVCKNDIYGKPVYTLWKWMAESLWYTSFADGHPECKVINATEGGIGFLNVENLTLKEVKERYLGKQWDLQTRLFGEIRNSPLPQSYNDKEILDAILSLKDNLTECAKRYQTLLRITADEAQNPLKNEKFQERLALEKALINEKAYDVVLKRFNEDYLKGKELEYKRLEMDKPLLSQEEYSRRKALLEFDRFTFLRETALCNTELVDMLVQRHKQRAEQDKNKSVEKEKAALCQQYPIPAPKADDEYVFDKKQYRIKDPELHLDHAETFNGKQQLRQECLHYPSGQMKQETYYLNDSLHGPSTFYAENGAVLSRAWYIQGKQEGKMFSYYPNGSLHSLQMFEKGLPVGTHRFFYPDGQPKSLLPFKRGLLHGEVRLFHPDAILARELTFVDGKRNGQERIWNRAGQLLIECQYDADRPVGTSRLWHWNGVLAKEILYNDDFVQIVAKEWDSQGVSIENKKDDYFDQMNAETHHLTASLERMVREMTTLTPAIKEKIQANHPGEENGNDLSAELAKLQKELERLQSLDTLLKEQFSQEDAGKEAIWKTLESQKEIEKQFEGVKDKINTDLGDIGKGIQKIVKKLLDDEDQQGKSKS